MPERCAAIDIGTNTVLLLVAEYEIGGQRIGVLQEEQRIPRLGKGVDRDKNLAADSVRRVISVLQEFRELLQAKYPGLSHTIVTATSAVRDADNKEAFCRRVRRETGYEVRVLSGEEEAERTYFGALSMLERPVKSRSGVIDIGGGSTEVALGTGSRLAAYHSYDLGSVRFTERFLHHDPPLDREIQSCREAIGSSLQERTFPIDNQTEVIGVAGTVTALAGMQMGMDAYEPQRLSGYYLEAGGIRSWIEEFRKNGSDKILARYPTLLKGRADVFIAGMLILVGFLTLYDKEGLTVSTGGIRHGSVVEYFNTLADK